MNTEEQIINQTKKWIQDVVIGCNFCPFAATPAKNNRIFYRVDNSQTIKNCLPNVLEEAIRLDNDISIETTLLIIPQGFDAFNDYLDLVTMAEKLLKKYKYEGIYQLASFHPDYLFAGTNNGEPANYTNRSPYPMLHLLREDSIEKVLKNYKNPEAIPKRNIAFAKEKGLLYMQALRDASLI